ncbi:hypothetical protein ABK040_008364 [Willaertia magna]
MPATKHRKQPFDLLICTNILLFLHCKDWSISKPYLISSTFNQVFKTVEFSKQYLINIFQLNKEEIIKIEYLLQQQPKILNNDSNNFNKKENEQKKKKIKLEENILKISNFYDILQLYVKQIKNRMNIIKQHALQYEIENNPLIVDKMINILTLEKVNKILSNKLQNFITSDMYNLPKLIILDLFGKLKGIFVTQFKEIKREESSKYFIEYIVFSNCGFPLIIQSHYSHEIDTYRSNHNEKESVLINSKELFFHEVFSNEHSHFSKEFKARYDDKLLKDVKEILFTKKDETTLQQYDKVDLELTLNTILFDWFKVALSKYCRGIEGDEENGIPGGFPTIYNQPEDGDDEMNEEDRAFIVDDEEIE